MPRPREFDQASVLDAALDAFWTGSYRGTSTQDLCDSTGLARSSLFNTFSSKAELYRAALERYGERKRAERREILESSGTGGSLLEGVLRATLQGQASCDSHRSCMVINAAVELGDEDSEVARLTRSQLDQFRDFMAVLIDRGQRDGSLTTGMEAASVASVVHAALNGMQVRARVQCDPAAMEEGVRTLMRLISVPVPVPDAGAKAAAAVGSAR